MSDTYPTDSPQLLLIEDDPVSRHLVRCVMDRLNRPLDTAASGPEALERCRRQRFDLILMDLHMPGMDGYATRRHILDILAGNAIPPMICLTADTRPETRARLRQEGFCECLYKPLDVDRLAAILDRHAPMPAGMIREPVPAVIPAQLRAELYGMLLETLPQERADLLRAYEDDNHADLERIAHTLAGNAAICGVSTLSIAAIKLEQSLRLGPQGRSQASLDLLLHLIDPLLTAG